MMIDTTDMLQIVKEAPQYDPSLPIRVIKSDNWFLDMPVTYDSVNHQILVKDSYDYLEDSHGWVRHYLVHHMHYLFGIPISDIPIISSEEQDKPYSVGYPNRSIDKFAYSLQFLYLEKHKKLKDFHDVINLVGKEQYVDALARFWNNAASNIVEFNLLCVARFIGSKL